MRSKRDGQKEPQHGEVYFEFIQLGRAIKVVAVDATTGTEVTIAGPASTPQSELQRLALLKLQKRLSS